jgi:hypothetical protein
MKNILVYVSLLIVCLLVTVRADDLPDGVEIAGEGEN